METGGGAAGTLSEEGTQQPREALLSQTAQKRVTYSSLSKLDDSGPTPAQLETAAAVRIRCRRLIISRHLLAALADRMFEFAVTVLLTRVGLSDSFTLIASYGITVDLVVAAFSPSLGAFLDRRNRLSGIVAVTVLQNICVTICGICFLALLYTNIGPETWWWHAAIVLIHITGSGNSLFAQQTTVCLERDWVVVIAGPDEAWLRSITANLKQIDLICALVAPFLISLLQIINYEMIALVISAANVLMIMLQFSAFGQIYSWIPQLAKASPTWSSSSSHHFDDAPLTEKDPDTTLLGELGGAICGFFSHGAVYFRQSSVLAGLALAMLYLTVLSFHMVMISYLLLSGLRLQYIGIAQGLSSGSGFLGAVAYEHLAAKIGEISTGVVAIWYQVAFLTVALGGLLYPQLTGQHHDFDVYIFIGAVILSRFGLYMFDVAAAQVFQFMVEEDARNVVGGFQNTLQSLFELASFVIVLMYPHPDQFVISATVSYVMVAGAAVLFSIFACKVAMAKLRTRRRSRDGLLTGETDPLGGGRDGSRYASVQQTEEGDLLPNEMLVKRLSTIVSVGDASTPVETPNLSNGAGSIFNTPRNGTE